MGNASRLVAALALCLAAASCLDVGDVAPCEVAGHYDDVTIAGDACARVSSSTWVDVHTAPLSGSRVLEGLDGYTLLFGAGWRCTGVVPVGTCTMHATCGYTWLDVGWEEWPAGDGCNWCRRRGANVGVAQCTSLSCDGEAGGTDDHLLYTGHVRSGSSGP